MSRSSVGKITFKRVLISLIIFVILAVFLCASVEAVILLSATFVDISEHTLILALVEIAFLLFAVLNASFIDGIASGTSKFEFIKRIATFSSRYNYNWQGGCYRSYR